MPQIKHYLIIYQDKSKQIALFSFLSTYYASPNVFHNLELGFRSFILHRVFKESTELGLCNKTLQLCVLCNFSVFYVLKSSVLSQNSELRTPNSELSKVLRCFL